MKWFPVFSFVFSPVFTCPRLYSDMCSQLFPHLHFNLCSLLLTCVLLCVLLHLSPPLSPPPVSSTCLLPCFLTCLLTCALGSRAGCHDLHPLLLPRCPVLHKAGGAAGRSASTALVLKGRSQRAVCDYRPSANGAGFQSYSFKLFHLLNAP